MHNNVRISVVTTLFFSENYIDEFYSRIKTSLQKIGLLEYELIFVNDGSPDNSKQRVLEIIKSDDKVKLVDLSRNFGHHKAIYTGLSLCRGEFIYLLDVDLEESPELIEDFWSEMQKNSFDVVLGVQKKRKGRVFERFSGYVYYSLFNKLSDISYPSNSLTARLMTHEYVDAVLLYKESEFDIWCTFSLVGFNQKELLVTKKNKGTTTYTLRKKLHMLFTSVTNASSKPLYFVFYLGLVITMMSICAVLYQILNKIIYLDYVIEGWTSLIISIWFLGGATVFSIGLVGLYISKVFLEVKQRPISIIKKIYEHDSNG